MPTGFSYDPAGPNITVSPCSLTFVINSPDQIYIQEIITLYQLKVFGCPKTDQGKIQVTVNVKNGGQFTALNLTHEKYSLSLPDVSKWTIKADYYVGFLRALETFSQLFNKQDDGTYQVGGFPITITDGPQYIWRALMIDTSRHFLDVDTIKRQIDAMLYIKLNILHWHIVDEDAFPMVVPTVPELSDSGSIGGTFS
jgi:hexosaminidase